MNQNLLNALNVDLGHILLRALLVKVAKTEHILPGDPQNAKSVNLERFQI